MSDGEGLSDQGGHRGLQDHVQHRGRLRDLQQLRRLLSDKEVQSGPSLHLRGQAWQLGCW